MGTRTLLSWYRKDVDGLRGIAVLAVVVYHFYPDFLPAGFLGVDIFFVISGFVVSHLLIREFESRGRIDIPQFYFRRFRRLFPAFAIVMAGTVFATIFSVSVWDARQILKPAFAALLGVSNFWFMNSDPYDSVQGQIQPFLHTWSLGVEEQFYLLLPICLVLVLRSRVFFLRPVLSSVGLLVGLTAIGTLAGFLLSPQVNFYSPITRAWEFAFGVLVAVILARRTQIAEGFIPSWAVLGAFGVLLWSLVNLENLTRGPSMWTLVLTVSVALLIAAGPKTALARFLQIRPLVGLGKISYSLYLWHYPILVFWPLWFGERNVWLDISALAAATTLAVLSYIFVEQPIRSGAVAKKVWATISLATAAISVISGGATYRAGFIPNFERDNLPDGNGITLASTGNSMNVIVVGDSHAKSLGPLEALAESNGLGFGYSIADSCPSFLSVHPILLVGPNEDVFPQNCGQDFIADRFEFLSNLSPSVIVLAARWQVYYDGWEPDWPDLKISMQESEDSLPLRREQLEPFLQETVDFITSHGHTVVLLYPTPDSFIEPVPRQLMETNDPWPPKKNISLGLEEWNLRKAGSYALLDSVNSNNVIRVYPDRLFCDVFETSVCVANTAFEIFYSDDDHLSASGASLVAQQIISEIDHLF